MPAPKQVQGASAAPRSGYASTQDPNPSPHHQRGNGKQNSGATGSRQGGHEDQNRGRRDRYESSHNRSSTQQRGGHNQRRSRSPQRSPSRAQSHPANNDQQDSYRSVYTEEDAREPGLVALRLRMNHRHEVQKLERQQTVNQETPNAAADHQTEREQQIRKDLEARVQQLQQDLTAKDNLQAATFATMAAQTTCIQTGEKHLTRCQDELNRCQDELTRCKAELTRCHVKVADSRSEISRQQDVLDEQQQMIALLAEKQMLAQSRAHCPLH